MASGSSTADAHPATTSRDAVKIKDKAQMARALLECAMTQRMVKPGRLSGNRAALRVGRGLILALRTDVIKKRSV